MLKHVPSVFDLLAKRTRDFDLNSEFWDYIVGNIVLSVALMVNPSSSPQVCYLARVDRFTALAQYGECSAELLPVFTE